MVLSSRRNQWLSCTSAVPSESVSVFFVCIAVQKCGKICQSYSMSNIDVSRDLVCIYYTDKWPVLIQRQWCQTSKTCVSFLSLSSLYCSSKVIRHHTRVMSVYTVEAADTHSTYLKTSYVLVFSFHIFGGRILLVTPQKLFSVYFHQSLKCSCFQFFSDIFFILYFLPVLQVVTDYLRFKFFLKICN